MTLWQGDPGNGPRQQRPTAPPATRAIDTTSPTKQAQQNPPQPAPTHQTPCWGAAVGSVWWLIRLFRLADDDSRTRARIGQPRFVVPGCDYEVMSLTASLGSAATRPDQRLEVLLEELAELAGQRNAIDGRIVEIVAELDRDELCGATGARSVAALVAWKIGSSSANAHTITTVAHRLEAFPRCAQGMREGRLSLDQVGVIAARAGEGSDEHYAQLARCATVNQLRSAVKLEPRPEPNSRPEPQRLDHQDLQRGVQLLADHTSAPRRGEVRRGAGVSS